MYIFAARAPCRIPSTPVSAAATSTPGVYTPEDAERVHAFFPFDPYKPSRSSSYTEPIYRDWARVIVDVDDDDDDEEEEGEGEEDEVDLDVRAEADGLGASLGEMKISPVPAAPHRAAVALGISSIVG